MFEKNKKNNWVIKESDYECFNLLKNKFNFSDILASVISKRVSLSEVENYINPKIKNLLPNPLILNDVEEGVKVITEAIFKNQKIIIYGDYDVDGATSTALLIQYFRMINFHSFDFFIPKRSDGYGLNLNDVKKIYDEGAQLIIAVDCGTLSFKEVEYAKSINKKIIIIDHHSAMEKLPKADALINPKRLDQILDEKNQYLMDLCAAGIVFVFLVALQTNLRNNNFFQKNDSIKSGLNGELIKNFVISKESFNQNFQVIKNENNEVTEPNLMSLLDLVALGTVLDVVPLTNLNRAFVKSGLKIINNEIKLKKINENSDNEKNHISNFQEIKMNCGIMQLINEINISGKINTYHLGFLIGPRINASGRINDVRLGTQLLTESSKIKLEKIAKELNEINLERQKIEKKILEEVTELVQKNKLYELPIILINGASWHHGVIGIVASRIKDTFYRPTIICEKCENFSRGSARSIKNFDIGKMIHEAKNLNLLISGGGHKMAGGLSVDNNKWNDFYEFCFKYAKEKIIKFEKEIEIDEEISLKIINEKFLDEFEIMEPFGIQNSTPKFLIKNLKIIFINVLNEKHLKFKFLDESQNQIIGIFWGGYFLKIYEDIQNNINSFFSIVCFPQKNNFNSKTEIQLIIEDIKMEILC